MTKATDQPTRHQYTPLQPQQGNSLQHINTVLHNHSLQDTNTLPYDHSHRPACKTSYTPLQPQQGHINIELHNHSLHQQISSYPLEHHMRMIIEPFASNNEKAEGAGSGDGTSGSIGGHPQHTQSTHDITHEKHSHKLNFVPVKF